MTMLLNTIADAPHTDVAAIPQGGTEPMPTTATAKAARPRIRYFHDGRPVTDVHNRLGHVASLYTKGCDGDRPRIGRAELASLLEKKGVTDPRSPGWMVELPNGVTLECRPDGHRSQYKQSPAKATKPVAKKTPGQKARAAKKPALKAATKRNGSTKVTPLPTKSTAKRSTRKSA